MAKPTLKPLAYLLILLLAGAAAVSSFVLFTQASFGPCAIIATGSLAPDAATGSQSGCTHYLYAFAGAPVVVGLLLLALLPSLVTTGEAASTAKIEPAPAVAKKTGPPPIPPKPTTDAAVQLLALFQREGRLVDFLREDIQSYDDAQIGAAVRTIHEACRQVLGEHVTLEPVLNGTEGDDIVVPNDFNPSAIRLTGNVVGEPPFRGALRHPGWRAAKVKLPAQPTGQDPQIVAPAEVEIL